MKIVAISDTHSRHRLLKIPECDLLIHAGDLTKVGNIAEITEFNKWLGELEQVKYKVFCAGNHDFLFETKPELARSLITNGIYLENSGIEIEGVKIWASPVTPKFLNWAFNIERGKEIKKYWDIIPDNTDILITHGPPVNILDKTLFGNHVGCSDLSMAIKQKKPKLSVFGHIHEGYGFTEQEGITYINASSLNKWYISANKPIVLDFNKENISFL